jgi:LytR cell envelope-related transcriptional attenuator
VLRAGTMLFGHVGSDGELDLLVAFGWDHGAHSGTMMLVPSHTLVEVPSLGAQPLADVARLTSPSLLRVVVENALGARFDTTVLVDDNHLASLFAAAGPLDVDFPVAARLDDDAGVQSFDAGPQRIDPSLAVRLLTARPTDELSPLVTVGAVLSAWRGALAGNEAGHATLAADRRVRGLVSSARTTMQNITLPVDPLSGVGGTQYKLRAPDASDAVAHAFGWAMLAEGTRSRVQVLNGTGDVGITQRVAGRVVPAGGQVTLTANAPGFGVRRTLVVYYRASALPAARRLARALGVGTVARSAEDVDVVDITVVVGEDFTGTR